MKIAFISQYFFPEPFSNNELVQELCERGHKVDVITCVPNYPDGEFYQGFSNRTHRSQLWSGARVWRARTISRGKSSLRLVLNYLSFPVFAILEMHKRLKQSPDVCFVSMPSPLFQAIAGIWLKWRFGTPLVYWVQDLWPESAILTLELKNPFVVKPLNWVCGWIYRQADLLLVQSEAFPERICKFGVPPERLRVFPNTAPSNFLPMAPQEASKVGAVVPDAPFKLMFAGNIGQSQDFDTLLAAADILRDSDDLLWVIVGDGRDLQRVIDRIARLQLHNRFVFLGRHPTEQMPAFFSNADAMLVSLKDDPIFSLTVPYKVQCYMACGKPIIASLSGEGSRIIREADAGLSAPSGSPGELAKIILEMLSRTKQQRSQMGQNGRDYFEKNYSREVVYDKLELWLTEAAQGRSS